MKICLAHGGDVSQPSGGTDRVTALASGLQARGYGVTLVVPEPVKEYPDRLEGVDIQPVETDFLGLENALTRASAVTKTARSLAESEGAQLQLEHSSLAGIGTLRGCDEFILDMHDIAYPRFDHVDTPFASLLKRGVASLERRAVRRARHIVVVSEYMREFLHDQWGVPSDDVSVVPNGFFADRIEEWPAIESEPGRVCFLGTLHPKVDVKVFEAIADLEGVSELVIIGDGALRNSVSRLAQAKPAVRATGRLPDEEAFDLVASAELVVNPQTPSELQRSSSPVKLFYYAALGKPMVVSGGPSIVDELVSANAARSAETRTRFVEEVEEVLHSETLRRELSRNAVTLATEFHWSARTDKLAEVLEKHTVQARV